MNKLTDSEIVKALEICANEETDLCTDYPCLVDDCCTGYHYREDFVTTVLDLIKRKDAEIERLEKARQKQAQFLGEERGQKYELINKITKAKSEAINEFAEKLKCRSHRFKTIDRIFVDCIPLDYIDNLVKEMVGESNAQFTTHNSQLELLREKCVEHQDFHEGDDGVFRAYVSIEDLDNIINDL